MNPTRFDGLTKSLAAGTSRRRMLRALLGGAAGAAGISHVAGATSVTGACHAYCHPQAKPDRRPCYDACLACGGDTSRVCQAGDGSFTCCPTGTTCQDGTCVCGTDYQLCEGSAGSHCCPSEGSCNPDGTCACLPNNTYCSAYFGTCGYCCGGGYFCNVQANTCQCY